MADNNIKTAWEEIGLSDDFLFGKVMQNPVSKRSF